MTGATTALNAEGIIPHGILKGADGLRPSSCNALHRGLRLSDLRTGGDSPLQQHVPPRCSRNLPFPTVADPEELPLRPERHIPNSIETVRFRLANAIARTLPRCPCAGKAKRHRNENL